MAVGRLLSEGLKEILIQESILDEKAAARAEAIAKERDKAFLEVVIGLGFASDSEVAVALVKYLSLPYIDASRYFINRELLKYIPTDTIAKHKILPLDLIGNNLIVAICDYTEKSVFDEIKRKTGFNVRPWVTTFEAFRTAMHELPVDTDEKTSEIECLSSKND